MADIPPGYGRTGSTFGEKTVNMRIPFKIPSKSVKDADKARSKTLRFIDLEKHTGDDTVYC